MLRRAATRAHARTMPRNAEVIRQWQILRHIEASRLGASIDELATLTAVTTRTIRRDLEALQEAGFPIYDAPVDGRKRWRLDGQPFKALGSLGFSLSEACALYFSRSMLEGLAGAPFRDDLARAFAKLETALGAPMRRFIDRLPGVLAVKAAPGRGEEPADQSIAARLVDAAFHRRRVEMRYHSLSHSCTKDYVVEPYRLLYGQGALYLIAFVPEYGETRTFAVNRIRHLSVLDEHFAPGDGLPADTFDDSLGVYTGPPVTVVLEFDPRAAGYVRERRWHRSQHVADLPNGGVRLTLEVSDDWALRTWILGYGSLVRVVSPPSLAKRVLDQLEEARTQYAPRPRAR